MVIAIGYAASNALASAIVGLVVVAIITAVVYYGLRALGQPTWASRVAAVILALGCLLVLLSLP